VIKISIGLDKWDCIKECSAEGHSLLAKPGTDILCAAVTALLRTAYRLLYSKELIMKDGKTPVYGNLAFTIDDYPIEERSGLKGITDFLILGLNDLASEYPERLEIIIKKAFNAGE
jgi:uncharacterized protein YsxB (DUF464 family)